MSISPESLNGIRVTLSSIGPEVVDGPYFEWMQDEVVLQYLEARFADRTKSGLRTFILNCNVRENVYLFGIFEKQSGSHIGNLKIDVTAPHHRGEIGIIVGSRAAQGQGYGTDAIQTVVAFAFNSLKLEKLTAGVYAPNVGSARAFEKSGFKLECIRRNHFWSHGEAVDGLFFSRFWDDEKISCE